MAGAFVTLLQRWTRILSSCFSAVELAESLWSYFHPLHMSVAHRHCPGGFSDSEDVSTRAVRLLDCRLSLLGNLLVKCGLSYFATSEVPCFCSLGSVLPLFPVTPSFSPFSLPSPSYPLSPYPLPPSLPPVSSPLSYFLCPSIVSPSLTSHLVATSLPSPPPFPTFPSSSRLPPFPFPFSSPSPVLVYLLVQQGAAVFTWPVAWRLHPASLQSSRRFPSGLCV